MKVQITSNHLTVTLNLLGGLTVTGRVLNVTVVITRFYIKSVAQSACHCVSCSDHSRIKMRLPSPFPLCAGNKERYPKLAALVHKY